MTKSGPEEERIFRNATCEYDGEGAPCAQKPDVLFSQRPTSVRRIYCYPHSLQFMANILFGAFGGGDKMNPRCVCGEPAIVLAVQRPDAGHPPIPVCMKHFKEIKFQLADD